MRKISCPHSIRKESSVMDQRYQYECLEKLLWNLHSVLITFTNFTATSASSHPKELFELETAPMGTVIEKF